MSNNVRISLRKPDSDNISNNNNNKRKGFADDDSDTIQPYHDRGQQRLRNPPPPTLQSVATVMSKLSSSVKVNHKQPGDGLIDYLKAARKLSMKSKQEAMKLMQHGAIPIMLSVLDKYHNPLIVSEALFCLSNIAYLNEGSNAIVCAGGLDHIVPFVMHPTPIVAQNALWTIGNIATDNGDHRRLLFQCENLLRHVFNKTDPHVIEASAFATKALLTDMNPPQLLLDSVAEDVFTFFVQAVKGNVSVGIVSDLMEAFAKILWTASNHDAGRIITKNFVDETIMGALTMADKNYLIYHSAALIFRKAVQVDGVGAHFIGTKFLESMMSFSQRTSVRGRAKALISVLEGLIILAKKLGDANHVLFAHFPDDLIELLQYSSEQTYNVKKPCIALLSIIFKKCNRAVYERYHHGVEAMCHVLEGSKDPEQILDILQCFDSLVRNHELLDLGIDNRIESFGGIAAIWAVTESHVNDEIFRWGNAILEVWDGIDGIVDQNDASMYEASTNGLDTSKSPGSTMSTAFGGSSFENAF